VAPASAPKENERWGGSHSLDAHALDLGPFLPSLAVWLNSNHNKVITEKQDKELLKKK